MIHKLLLSTVAMAAVASTAFAADLPSRRAPPVYVPPVPTFTWTGFYMGGDIGYQFGKDNVVQTAAPIGAGPTVVFGDGFPSGVVGGGHVGYNLSTQSLPVLGQVAGGLSGIPFIGGVGGSGGVVGVEGDIRGSDYRSNSFGGAFSTRNEISGTIRGRVGIAVDRALFFATGGVAFAQFINQYNAPVLAGGFNSISTTRIGYVVGGGIEYALTTNFSLRVEYRYEDFGRYTQAPAFVAAVPGFTATHRDTIQAATVGFSYKFDNPIAAPVVARY